MVRDVMPWVRRREVSRMMPTLPAQAAGWLEVPFAKIKKMKMSVLFL